MTEILWVRLPAETRHLITTHVTYRLLQQRLTASFVAFVAANDEDAYLRPSLSYAWSDALTVAGGANVLVGGDVTFGLPPLGPQDQELSLTVGCDSRSGLDR